MLIDTDYKAHAETVNQLNAYHTESDGITAVKGDLTTEIHNRLQGETDHRKWLVMIKDLKDFATRSKLDDDELPLLLEEGTSVGIHFIVCGDYGFIGSSYEPAHKYSSEKARVVHDI